MYVHVWNPVCSARYFFVKWKKNTIFCNYLPDPLSAGLEILGVVGNTGTFWIHVSSLDEVSGSQDIHLNVYLQALSFPFLIF